MKKIYVLVMFCLWGTITIAQKQKVIDNDKILSWDTERKLTWDDFKASTDPDTYGFNDAMTTYTLEILPETVQVDEQDRIQGYQKMDIATYFFKKKSWTVKTDNLSLLAHEQLHFDIAELFARKMRKRFAELKKNKIDTFDAYQNTYTTLWKSCRMYQRQYDDETKHGKDIESNEKWIKKVHKELQELNDFSR